MCHLIGDSNQSWPNDFAFDPSCQFGVVSEPLHELMNRRRRRMNPAQFSRDFELLRTQGPADYDFRVPELGFNSFIAGFLGGLHGGKILMQAFRKPGWRVPQFEGMVDQRQEFHRIKFNHGGHRGHGEPNFNGLDFRQRQSQILSCHLFRLRDAQHDYWCASFFLCG